MRRTPVGHHIFSHFSPAARTLIVGLIGATCGRVIFSSSAVNASRLPCSVVNHCRDAWIAASICSTRTGRLRHQSCMLIQHVGRCGRAALEGTKRSREEVLAAVPTRAVLSLSRGRPGWHSGSPNPPLMAGLVVPGKAEWAVPPLDPARVTTIKSGALLVVGVQELLKGRSYESFPQVWWCRVVGGHQEGVRS
jgi:hypothetical protein